MNKKYIVPLAVTALLAAGCSKENPFDSREKGDGELLKSALSMDIKADALKKSRAAADVDMNEFNVIFTQQGHSEPYAKYKYGEMPEVITLPAGVYTCTATYGELRNAEWDSPYFLGMSGEFSVTPYEITSYIDPIVCTLENVKVTVDFDAPLRAAMSADSYVEVKVGGSEALRYGVTEADAAKAGYFKLGNEISLVAVFHGTIDGVPTVETKSLRDVAKGNHYNITFRLHSGTAGGGTGDADADITVDAAVSVVNVERNVPLGDEPLLDDSERPGEGGGDDPNPPTPPADIPEVMLDGPFEFDVVNNGSKFGEGDACIVNISSKAEGGIQELLCTVESEALEDVIVGMFGSTTLNIANTDPAHVESLNGFGFPSNVGGGKEASFNLSTFIGMMAGLGQYTHTFRFYVKDANGEVTKDLIIKF